MAIRFRQFHIIEDYPRETEVPITDVTLRDVVEYMEREYRIKIQPQLFRDSVLRPDILLLVNGRAVFDRTAESIVLQDDDVVECLAYAVGG